ncbi:hypothetical protein [Ferruginibacter albus]|uniref:hypothetical protein n=1 Tax=Ferruginibacter albus TaxID=2875540 RepID=UPI001CC5B5CC|nr:hypothetical protein [Ferruginibacter albus]UAY52521.1 hypothetical protein K9M53_02245 [Ferruginibacter albus]
MRKLTLIFGALFLFNTHSKAQAYTGQSDFNKTMQSAAIVELPFENGTTSDAINNKFKSLGYSSKSSGDYKLYKGIKLAELGDGTYDIYLKVDKKSKKEKDRSVVYMLISSGYEKFIPEAANADLFNNAKTFLNNLMPSVVAVDLENQITAQEDAVKKANKKLSNLNEDGEDLAKKQKKLEQDIADNKSSIANQQKEVAAQQQILETLKSKRK